MDVDGITSTVKRGSSHVVSLVTWFWKKFLWYSSDQHISQFAGSGVSFTAALVFTETSSGKEKDLLLS